MWKKIFFIPEYDNQPKQNSLWDDFHKRVERTFLKLCSCSSVYRYSKTKTWSMETWNNGCIQSHVIKRQLYLRILVSAWPTPLSVFSTILVLDSAKITDSEELKRVGNGSIYSLTCSPTKLETLECSTNGDFHLVQEQGSFEGWRTKQSQVNRAVGFGLVCNTCAWATRMFGNVIKQ